MANPLYVALLFAGLFRGHEVTKMEFRRAVIRELQADGVGLHAYLAGYESDKLAWLNWYGNTTEYTWVTLPEDADLQRASPSANSYFSTCANEGYHLQYAHLNIAWQAAHGSGHAYTHAIKLRNDFVYHPHQFFRSCWLNDLPEAVVLANDVEVNAGDRWNERGPENRFGGDTQLPLTKPTFPYMQSDQFIVGTFSTMSTYFSIDQTPPRAADACDDLVKPWANNIEVVLADFLFRKGIVTYAVSFQIRKNVYPGYTNGACARPVPPDYLPRTFIHAGWRPDWLYTPCRMCYDCLSSHRHPRA